MARHRWTGSATFSSAATAWSSSSLRRSPPNIPTNSSRFESMKKYKYKHLYSWMRSGSMSTTPCSTCPRSTCSLVSSTISRQTRITRSACFSKLFTDLQEIQLVLLVLQGSGRLLRLVHIIFQGEGWVPGRCSPHVLQVRLPRCACVRRLCAHGGQIFAG